MKKQSRLLVQALPDAAKLVSLPYDGLNGTICSKDTNGFLERCVSSKSSIYFPPYFASQTTNGYGTLMKSVFSSLDNYIYSTDFTNTTSNDFWFLYESLFVEAKRATLDTFKNTSSVLIARLKENILIGQIVYGVSLILVVVAFFVVLRPLHQKFVDEIRWQRQVLFLVPQQVLRESPPFANYILIAHNQLFSGH
jgi:hypothetical protein